MRRFTTLTGALVLVVAACSGSASPAATLGPATATPAAATPGAATATPAAISATVTFDGQACTYAGPAVIPRGAAVTFTLVNTPARANGSLGAALKVAPVRDGTTWAQALAWVETQHILPWPEWVLLDGALNLYPPDHPDRVDLTGTIVMTSDQYIVQCGTSPDEGEKPFVAALIKVLDGG